MGWTWTIAVARARRSPKSTRAGSSMAGLVSGCDTMVVTPPAAAAWLAEAKVSRYSAPGSPTKARMSMRPGAATLPRQSTTSVPSGTPAAPMPRLASRMTPAAIKGSPSRSRSRDGSMIRALVRRMGRRSERTSRIREIPRQRFEHRHPHCDPHLDLLADQGPGAVGNARVDLDAAVHRAGVHHQRVGFGVGKLLRIEAEIGEILLGGGHQRAVHALALEAWWRTTRMSGCMALSVMAVSISVSPLRMEDELTDMFMTSAPSRLPASSKEDWVRVEASKNRLIWVRPRNDVPFFSIWRLRSTNSSARSSIPTISSGEIPSIPNRCRWRRTKACLRATFIKAAPIGAFCGAGKGAFETVPRV